MIYNDALKNRKIELGDEKIRPSSIALTIVF